MKLSKITLEDEDGHKIHLSPEKAKDLYAQLHELFGKCHQPHYIPYYQKYCPTEPWTASPQITWATGIATS